MKSVSISEGGKGRIFPQTDKLKINNVGGGNSLWLPEDEVVTGTLYADENGIYLAENDGFSCYDTVVVRVEDETDPDDPDWELDPDELDEDVWDEESVEEFQEDPEAFEEKFNDKEKWKAEKAKKEKSQKIKKVKSLKPSKITGIDPVDGNPYQVGVDSEGNLTKEMLPSSIHIVVPPWKREYENGEEINFYGMHVYLLDKDGHPFKTEQYPTGEIPFEELLLPVTIAEGGGESSKTATSGLINYPISFSSSGYTLSEGKGTGRYDKYDKQYHWVEYSDSAVSFFFVDNSSLNVYRVNASSTNSDYSYVSRYRVEDDKEDPPSIEWIDEGQSGTAPHSYQYTHNNKTVYYSTNSTRVGSIFPDNGNPEGFNTDDAKYIAWTMIYGDISESGNSDIPVQWMRSDGEMLEDKFKITVSEGSGNDSSSETSDSGSGHTSGGF